jgi:hypothetical protein
MKMKKRAVFLAVVLLAIAFAAGFVSSAEAAQKKKSAVMSADDFVGLCATATPGEVQAAIDAGADVNARDMEGWTALMCAAQSNDNPEVISVLAEAGAEIDAPDNDGRTPLMCAAQGNANPEIVPALLKAGADLNAKDKEGKTALILVGENENSEIAALLEKAATVGTSSTDADASDEDGEDAPDTDAEDTADAPDASDEDVTDSPEAGAANADEETPFKQYVDKTFGASMEYPDIYDSVKGPALNEGGFNVFKASSADNEDLGLEIECGKRPKGVTGDILLKFATNTKPDKNGKISGEKAIEGTAKSGPDFYTYDYISGMEQITHFYCVMNKTGVIAYSIRYPEAEAEKYQAITARMDESLTLK